MPRVEYPKQRDGHYHLPICIWTATGQQLAPIVAMVDTGASKCVIPKAFNDAALKLPVAGHDSDVKTASAPMGYDYVVLPKVGLVSFALATTSTVTFQTVGLDETDVKAWLGENFIVGMNFLSTFDISLMRKNFISVER
jgi:predicted aspartyl protease